MNSSVRGAFLVPVLLMAAGAGTGTGPAAQGPSDNVQVITMTAKKYEFDPSTIHVKKGTKVELKITALDRTHGFKIELFPEGSDAKGQPGLVFTDPQESWKLEKEQERTIEFTAVTPGTYAFKCAIFCGFGHLGMKGQLIVDP